MRRCFFALVLCIALLAHCILSIDAASGSISSSFVDKDAPNFFLVICQQYGYHQVEMTPMMAVRPLRYCDFQRYVPNCRKRRSCFFPFTQFSCKNFHPWKREYHSVYSISLKKCVFDDMSLLRSVRSATVTLFGALRAIGSICASMLSEVVLSLALTLTIRFRL
jgi:hypothetical protein